MNDLKVYLKPEHVLSYWENHKEELHDTMKVIAETLYDDADTKCYLLLTEDSGRALISIESIDSVLDSTYLSEDNATEVVLNFSNKLEEKQLSLTWEEIKQKYPNQLVGLTKVKWVTSNRSRVESAVVMYTNKTMSELVEIQIQTKGKVVLRDTADL